MLLILTSQHGNSSVALTRCACLLRTSSVNRCDHEGHIHSISPLTISRAVAPTSAMRPTPITMMARLVHNHSSIAPGLAPVLKRLAERLPNDDTVTPGRLAKTRGTAEHFRLTFGASGPELYGFKLIARKGKLTQEVFVSSKLTMEEMEAHVRWCVEKVHG